jgi:hypothetical protein
MQFSVPLRLLHAWRHVPHDDGKRHGRNVVLLQIILVQGVAVRHHLHVFGISSVHCFCDFTYRPCFRPAGLSATVQTSPFDLPCR